MQTKALLVSNDLASMHISTYNKYKPMYQYIDKKERHYTLLYYIFRHSNSIPPQYFGLFAEAQHIRYPILQKNSLLLVSLYFLCVLLQRRQTIYITRCK